MCYCFCSLYFAGHVPTRLYTVSALCYYVCCMCCFVWCDYLLFYVVRMLLFCCLYVVLYDVLMFDYVLLFNVLMLCFVRVVYLLFVCVVCVVWCSDVFVCFVVCIVLVYVCVWCHYVVCCVYQISMRVYVCCVRFSHVVFTRSVCDVVCAFVGLCVCCSDAWVVFIVWCLLCVFRIWFLYVVVWC